MKPLEGIKVIELAAYVAGPAAGRLLGEFGAEVIHIEGPKGDPNRGLGAINGAPFTDDCNPIFDTTNFNKKFVCLETKTQEGKDVLFKLLETADVFLTNYRSNVLVKMGLDYESIKDRYPKLVWAQCLGFGEKGPERLSAGFDFTAYGARGGLAGSVGQEGVPINGINAFGDTQTSQAMTIGILTALMGRAKTGKGDKVTGSLHGVACYNLHWGIIGAYYGSHYPKSRKNVVNPIINTYMASDGVWLQLCGAAYDIYIGKTAKILGIEEEIMGNPDYAVYANVCEKKLQPEIIEILGAAFAKRTSADLLAAFKADSVPCEKCYTFDDVLEDEQAYASGILVKRQCADGSETVIVNNPIRLASLGDPDPIPSRGIGADTYEFLLKEGWTQEELDQLAANGTIKQL